MKKQVVLISKDALCKSYLPIYGNKYNKMPNLCELAAKGTVFTRFYTAAPSSAMSYLSMFTGKNPYETDKKNYVPIKEEYNNAPNMFDDLASNGYSCHIVWDKRWYDNAFMYSKCFGKHTKFHNMHIEQVVGCHNTKEFELKKNDQIANNTIAIIKNEIKDIVTNSSDKLFIWIHLPHVLNGRTCYGSDMDLFDDIIGYLRTVFPDDSIFISSDHGNMNGFRNKTCYGFDVYEPAIQIPLITPRINNIEICDIPVSNIAINKILNEEIPQNKFIYSDCAYYAQKSRKLAIIHGNYKYIYNKATKTEELYDLRYDPFEQCNIANNLVLDTDRNKYYALNQVYFYPYWEESQTEYSILKSEWKRIWKEGTKYENKKNDIKIYLRQNKVLNKIIKAVLHIIYKNR